MSKNNNTLNQKEKQYRHLTKNDRIKIESLINQKDKNGKRLFNNTYIANYLGVHKSTISRELKNRKKEKMYIRTGKTKTMPYTAQYAQENADFKRGLSKGEYKLRRNKKLAKFIEDKIKIDKWAPDAIVGYMKAHNYFELDGFESITTPTIYNAIRYGIINVKLEDTRRMKYKAEYEYHNKSDLPKSKAEYSINNRPEEIDKRLYFGHFELDTVIGTSKGNHECLMTLTERKTRFEIIFKLKGKTAEEVVNKFNKMKEFMKIHYNKIFKSITTDNGTEFSDFLNIIKDTKTKIYFCHPYCSGEKGTNEKHNSIIRYFIPKGTLIEKYSYKDINKITEWMNNYPRKILNYKTPLEALQEEFNDKSILNKIYKLQEKINCL
ncbi:MAG TPA: IS30 family transposase [Candidatus Coprovivens excrementavium]|nr:IS30 family transposase [Candidatus Coprovivens excrementavium]